jgi:hypothetical protein
MRIAADDLAAYADKLVLHGTNLSQQEKAKAST